MRSSSDSIAQLASALAKAQTELVNPAKTLTGVIDRWGTGNEGQSYRYAPLSAGLDIVRNTLCKHELALIQTTHVDRDTAMVLLTTTLAHGSGEWICATWPVCRTADMANPKLMGAALTYARRYGLFTLVGIAGEDDLDAPDLPQSTSDPGVAAAAMGGGEPNGRHAREHGMGEEALRERAPGCGAGDHKPRVGPEVGAVDARAETLEPDPRSRFPVWEPAPRAEDCPPRSRGRPRSTPRQRLRTVLSRDPIRDLAEIDDPDGLFRWALSVLPLRNKLPDAAREALDAAFLAKADLLGTEQELPVTARSPPEADDPTDIQLPR